MPIQIVNLFDPVSNVFVGVYEAHESPAEPGQYIAPDDSTPVPLPVLGANETAVFSKLSGAWSVVPDFRGHTFYDQTTGAEVLIEEHGAVPATLGQTLPVAMVLTKSKNNKTAEINMACAAEIVGGFESFALGTAHHYTATLEDQSNLLGLIAIGLAGEFTCTNSTGVKARRLHTLAQLQQVLADGGLFKDGLLAKARTLKDRISDAPNVDLPDAAAVDALSW